MINDNRSVLERIRDDDPEFVRDFKDKFKEIEAQRVQAELDLIRSRMKIAIANFIKERKLTLKKMAKHRNRRKLMTVMVKVLIERDKELRSAFELPRASNKQLPRWGSNFGLERKPKETSRAFRQRILENIRDRRPG